MDSTSNIYGGQPTEELLIRDTVTKETKARYDELLMMISEILVKQPATEADSIALDECFKELQQMQKKGLDSTMNDTLKVLYFYMEGAGANPSQGDFKIDPVKIEALNSDDITLKVAVTSEDGKKTIQELKLAEAIKVMADPSYNPTATDSLTKMLLDFSSFSYDFYTSELEGLKQQLDIASTSINNLKALQDILNMVTVDDPQTIPLNPTSWDQIPAELQDSIINEIIHSYSWKDIEKLLPKDLKKKVDNELKGGGFAIDKGGSTTPQSKLDSLSPGLQNEITNYIKGVKFEPRTQQNLQEVSNYFKNNPSRYADLVTSLAKEGVGVTPKPEPSDIEAMNRLISARDELKAQFDSLNALGDDEIDKGEGSAYATLKVVLEDLEKYVPSSKYPPGCTLGPGVITDRGFDIPVETAIRYADGSVGFFLPDDLHKDICGYISAGHDKNNNINEAIDNAVNASQNLSSKMSDEIKAQNLNLQTWYDIMTQVADALNKSMQSAAQKTGG